VLPALDENACIGLFGVMGRLIEGKISSSDAVDSGSIGKVGSILLNETETCVLGKYRFESLRSMTTR